MREQSQPCFHFCVTLSNFLEPQFPHVYYGDNDSAFFTENYKKGFYGLKSPIHKGQAGERYVAGEELGF